MDRVVSSIFIEKLYEKKTLTRVVGNHDTYHGMPQGV